jgi:hypothetical protein
MLELAQTFQAKAKVDFQSSIRLADAQQQLTYTEEAKASGGTRGELTIPAELNSAGRVLRASRSISVAIASSGGVGDRGRGRRSPQVTDSARLLETPQALRYTSDCSFCSAWPLTSCGLPGVNGRARKPSVHMDE